VSIDFAYAQARVQARVGDRLPEAGWRALEATLDLAQYLAAVRNTLLAERIHHFSTAITPHMIDRTLRDDWRAEVTAVSRWVPESWLPAVEFTVWLPWLDAIDWLVRDEPVPEWMRDDPVLSGLAIDDTAMRRIAIDASPFAFAAATRAATTIEARWLEHWTELLPRPLADEATGLPDLGDAVARTLRIIRSGRAGPGRQRDARASLITRALHLVHRHAEEATAVFSYLLLVALDLQRLRDGLLRRALFHEQPAEQAP